MATQDGATQNGVTQGQDQCDVHKSAIFVFFIIVFYSDNTAFIDFMNVFYFEGK